MLVHLFTIPSYLSGANTHVHSINLLKVDLKKELQNGKALKTSLKEYGYRRNMWCISIDQKISFFFCLVNKMDTKSQPTENIHLEQKVFCIKYVNHIDVQSTQNPVVTETTSECIWWWVTVFILSITQALKVTPTYHPCFL